ncbi:XP_036357330.1uncharacterized protein LOC115209547 isoform X2 [Octopus vulgaris]|uniref:XP_036357330.1uncharacterized protein LOC115209547 isoform X2 n=1 Tax=Octopus vulgaris TaxID=6645 RepID=A0AA36ARE7_OCTVU|nr:XP_036357330.1uncharacterized protein LOC115209547 isoform X2 [Octopus vulgaris]
MEPYTRRRYTRLETIEAMKLLCLPSSNFVSKIPNRPAGGEIYLFQPRLRMYLDNWRTDGYRWSNRGTSTMSLNRRPALRKSFFYLMTKEGQKNNFQKHVYRLLDSDQKVVIHYIGDEKLCTDTSVAPSRKKSRHSSHSVRSILPLPEQLIRKKDLFERNNGHVMKKADIFEIKKVWEKVVPSQSIYSNYLLDSHRSNEYDKILETASELYTANQLPVKSQVIKSAHQQITPSYSLNKLDVEHRRKNPSSSASKSINSLSDANQSFSPPAKVPKKHNFSKPFISAGQTHVIDKPAAVSSSTTDTRSQPIDCSSSSSKNQSFSSKNIQKPQTAPKSEKQLQMSPTIDVSHQKEKRMLVVPNHQSSVMSNMSSLWKAGRLCDAYISNGTVSIMVHQIVFGAVCPKVLPVFYNAFHSDLPAVTFPSTVSEEALLAFCEYMYDGVLELDKNILSQLKIIAQCLDMQGFDQLCNNQLKIAENSVTVPTDMLESILTEPCSSSGLISDNATNTQITCQDNFTPVSQVIPSKLITLYNRNLEENSNVLSSKFPTEIKRKVVKQEISDTSNEQDDINSNHEDDLINKPQIKVELIGPDDHRYGYQDFLLAQQGSDISDADLTQSSLLSHNTSLDNFEQNSDIQQTEQSLLSSSSLSPHFSLHSESHPVGYITPTSIRRLVSCDKFQHLKNSENSKPYPVSLFSANYEPISLSSSNLQLVNVKKKHIAR